MLTNPSAAAAQGLDRNGQDGYTEECRSSCFADWCHTDTRVCDCHAVFSAEGFSLPSSAPAALGQGQGALGQGWRKANIPGWLPAPEKGLQVKESKLPSAGKGLFAAAPLVSGMLLPPYQGQLLTAGEVKSRFFTPGMEYLWCSCEPDKVYNMSSTDMSFCVDAANTPKSNPARYINSASDKSMCRQVNVEMCDLGQVLYFRITKEVQAGSELIVDYGKDYWPGFSGCG